MSERRVFHFETERGSWTKWFAPRHRNGTLACCGCGLVHDVQYKIGVVRGRPAVLMRARQNQKKTRELRRTKRFRP